jgi:protein-S-isoprenylcysteine O-methyltransferase Ste14
VFLRALLAFLALPGMVAFVVPLLIVRGTGVVAHPSALLILGLGVVALLWCVRDFYVSGKGTLAPWSPPRNLVSVGLYRYSRNPMYLSVLAILLGWALLFGSLPLLAYAVAVAIAFYLRVVLGEEPWLARTYATQWRSYSRAVPRWVGSRKWSSSSDA